MSKVIEEKNKNVLHETTKKVLYMVSTPIGNLSDITLRAQHLLEKTPIIAAEDTRCAKRLLAGLTIKTKAIFLSLHEHNEEKNAKKLVELLHQYSWGVYVSDAGTPGISDPGARLVRIMREADIQIIPIPGVSALTTILSVSSVYNQKNRIDWGVHFFGFPPALKRRKKFFSMLRQVVGSIILFESPHRIERTIVDLKEVFGNKKRMTLGRELTKHYEQIVESDLETILSLLKEGEIPNRGEFTLLFESSGESSIMIDAKRLFDELVECLPPRKAAGLVAKVTNESSSTLYEYHLSKSKSPASE